MGNEQFASQMNFLKTYADSFEYRKTKISEIKTKIEELQPQVELHAALLKEHEDLVKTNRQDEKFLITMNEMVLRNSGEPISNGPLFEKQNSNEDDDGKEENS